MRTKPYQTWSRRPFPATKIRPKPCQMLRRLTQEIVIWKHSHENDRGNGGGGDAALAAAGFAWQRSQALGQAKAELVSASAELQKARTEMQTLRAEAVALRKEAAEQKSSTDHCGPS